MPVQVHREPLIKQGWVRALLLFIVYVFFSVIAALLGDTFREPEGPGVNPFPSSSSHLMLFYIGSSFIVSLTGVFLFRKFIDKKSFVSLGLRPDHILSRGTVGLFSGMFLVTAGALLIYFSGGLKWVDISFRNKDLLTSIMLLLMVSLSEELVFRGYIMRNLRKSFTEWMSLLLSSFLFALVHISNPGIPVAGMLNIFMGGLVLGLTFMLTRSLWAPVLFHFAWNLFQGPLLGFPVSGLSFPSVLTIEEGHSTWLNGGNFGFEGSLVCSLMLLVACAVFFYLVLKGKRAANEGQIPRAGS